MFNRSGVHFLVQQAVSKLVFFTNIQSIIRPYDDINNAVQNSDAQRSMSESKFGIGLVFAIKLWTIIIGNNALRQVLPVNL